MTRCWAEISLPRLRANLEAVRGLLQAGGWRLEAGAGRKGSSPPLPSSPLQTPASSSQPPPSIIAVVKADAYGHGLLPAARCLHQAGVHDFAVSWVDDAVALRRELPQARILVLGGISPGEEEAFREHRLRAVVFDERPVPSGVKAELKIDTGMSRLGVGPDSCSRRIQQLGDRLAGIFSHFASADSDPEFTRLQIERFLAATRGVSCRRHLCNSAGLAYPQAWLEAVRVGLLLYGIPPCSRLEMLDLKPVLSWKARILAVNEVAVGSRSGYGGTWTARRPSRLGILPVGYADGYNRLLSNNCHVEVHGRAAPLAGMISMDLTTVDLTDIPQARPGDEAVLVSNDPASPLSAASLAKRLQTIPYEILTTIPSRLERIYLLE